MRISNGMIKNNLIYNIRNNYQRMSKSQVRLTTGQRYQLPSESPMATINSIYYRTRLNQIKQYDKNIDDAKGYIDFTYGRVNSTINIMQRLRELAVQSANSTLQHEDRLNIAMEVEEMLKEMVAQGNSQYKDQYIFSGGEINQKSFADFKTSHPNMPKPVISQVKYMGNNTPLYREIDLHENMKINLSGGEAFWGKSHVVIALQDSSQYLSPQDSFIKIDGNEVAIKQGDNLDTIIDKINNTVPSITAYKRELSNGNKVIALEGNYPHKMQIEDIKGGSVMQDLGILRSGKAAQYVEDNIHPNTIQSGASIFDVVIRFRDSLVENRIGDLGGKDLGDINSSLNNLVEYQGKISAKQSRLQFVEKKLAEENVYALEQLSNNEDVDIAEEATNFKTLESVHQISLLTGARLIQPTLMDYLK